MCRATVCTATRVLTREGPQDGLFVAKRSFAAAFHNAYHPYDEILARLEKHAAQHAEASLRYAGPIAVLTLRPEGAAPGQLPQAWVQGGIHPCERIGPHVVTRLADELLATPEVLGLAEWHLAPVIETEGYAATWDGDRFRKGCLNGINPNLNFPFQWGNMPPLLKVLRLFLPEIVNIGKKPIEAECVQLLIAELQEKNNLRLFLDFHSFGQKWLYPWGHTMTPSEDRKAHEIGSSIAVAAANAAGQRSYEAIPAAALEGPGGGTGLDYAYGELGCVHSYVVELPPALPKLLLAAAFRGLLSGDPKKFWKDGMDFPAEDAAVVGDEMKAAVFALAKHVFQESK